MNLHHFNAAGRAGRTRRSARRALAFGLLAFILPGSAPAESGTSVVLDGVYTNAGAVYILGDTGPFNTLVLTNQGWMENLTGVIGNQSSSRSNLAVVTGAGTLWQNSSALYVGGAGADNHLVISNTARVTAGQALIGVSTSSSNNRVTILGASSYLAAGEVHLGERGSGNEVVIAGGGALYGSGHCGVGYFAPSRNNTLRVIGPGATWGNGFGALVGSFGSSDNRVFITGGAFAYSRFVVMGSGSFNRVTLADPGTAWSNGDYAQVGNGGIGNQFLITNGARFTTVSAELAGDSNSIVVAGVNSILDSAGADGQLAIGTLGEGNFLRASEGARVNSRATYVFGSGNGAAILGAGTVWNNREILQLGEDYGTAANLRVGSGARLNTGAAVLPGDQGRLEVSGVGSLLDDAGLLALGGDYGGSNLLIVADGGRVHCAAGYIGGGDTPLFAIINTDNRALLTGPGSVWQITNDLTIGVTGVSSLLTITNGAQVHCRTGYVAYYGYSGNNTVTVTGTNSLWNNRGELLIGFAGYGNRVTIADGAQVNSTGGALGRRYSRDNTAIVTGPGARWDLTGHLLVGNSGSGNFLFLTNGGRVSSQSGAIDAPPGTPSPGRSNLVVIAGSNSLWSLPGPFTIGSASSANLLWLLDGGTLQAGSLLVGNAPGSFSNSVVVAGGHLIITNLAGNAPLAIGRGGLVLAGGGVIVDRLEAESGTDSVVDFTAGQLSVKAAKISNGRTFSVRPAAQLTLRRGLHSFADGLEVSAGAALSAAGTLTANVTNAGVLTTGAGADSLTLTPNLHLAAASVIDFEIGGPTPGSQFDFVEVSNTVRFGGALRLSLLNNFLPASNAVFTLMRFGAAGGVFANAPAGARLAFANSPVSCRVDYTSTSLRLSDFHNAAPAANLIDDAWAMQYFGHAPLTEAEREADPDGDGLNSYAEYLAGTDPLDPASVLRITSQQTNASGHVVLEFQSVPEKNYGISYSSDVTSWTEVFPITLTSPAAARSQWIDDGSQTGGLPFAAESPRRFYRISVR